MSGLDPYDLSKPRDFSTKPGQSLDTGAIHRAPLLAEIARLAAELEEAREAIRDAADETSGTSLVDDERLSYEEIQVTRGWREEWRALPAVRKALEGRK